MFARDCNLNTVKELVASFFFLLCTFIQVFLFQPFQLWYFGCVFELSHMSIPFLQQFKQQSEFNRALSLLLKQMNCEVKCVVVG